MTGSVLLDWFWAEDDEELACPHTGPVTMTRAASPAPNGHHNDHGSRLRMIVFSYEAYEMLIVLARHA
jgi:hypothetical protein